jgi:hypothetical protein
MKELKYFFEKISKIENRNFANMHPQSLKIVLVVYFYLTSKTLCQTFGGVMVADLLEMKKFSKDVPPKLQRESLLSS